MIALNKIYEIIYIMCVSEIKIYVWIKHIILSIYNNQGGFLNFIEYLI